MRSRMWNRCIKHNTCYQPPVSMVAHTIKGKQMKIAELQRLPAPVPPEQILEAAATVDDLFSYHSWNEQQQEQGRLVRNALADAYKSILGNVPPGPTRSRALNMLVDARMLANAAITFKGEV